MRRQDERAIWGSKTRANDRSAACFCSAKQVEEAQAAIAKAEAEKEALVAEAEASKAELARQNEEWKASLSAAEAQKAEELAARTEALKREFELEASVALCTRTLGRIMRKAESRAFRAWTQFVLDIRVAEGRCVDRKKRESWREESER